MRGIFVWIGSARQNQDLGEDEYRVSNDDDTQRSNYSDDNNNNNNQENDYQNNDYQNNYRGMENLN